jgi:hypothetical protein
MAKPILAVGWDVAGWDRRNQGVAVALLNGEPPSASMWRGLPVTVNNSTRHPLSLPQLIAVAWDGFKQHSLDDFETVVAVDAPFGFARGLFDLQNRRDGEPPNASRGTPKDRLAVRECERWVVTACFLRRPLLSSASFDKLGSNAAVAATLLRLWSNETGLPILPFAAGNERGAFIEVNPFLMRRVLGHFSPLMPARAVYPSEHTEGAALCALTAVAFALDGRHPELPRLLPPQPGADAELVSTEGWIYYPDPEWPHVKA